MATQRPLSRIVYQGGGFAASPRILPEEAAIALSFNGITQAVMMATPADLRDFATGFALTEGIARPDEIVEIDVVEMQRGIDVQCWLAEQAGDRLAARRRKMAGPVGCGLCGIDSIDEALRSPDPVTLSLRLRPAQVLAAVTSLPALQPLHDATRAAHAAAFWTPARGIVTSREDVGRHNALDKLAGALARAGAPRDGAIVLTSRVSIDMVQKTAAMGVPVLIAVSAPTAHAVEMAKAAGITLIGLARADRFELFTHPQRIIPEDTADVA